MKPHALAALLLCSLLPAQEKKGGKEGGIHLLRTPTGLDLMFYGHLKLDAAFDTARTNNGDTASFVRNYADSDARDNEFNATARHTRFGLKLSGGEWGFVEQAHGNIEVDFYDKSVFNNKFKEATMHGVRLRHAFARFTFAGGWEALAGQTWDLVGPHKMKKLNTLVGCMQGDIPFRRAQVRVTRKFDRGRVALALTRSIDNDLDGGGNEDGEDSGVPDVQVRVGLDLGAGTFGLGALYGDRRVEGVGHYHPMGVILDYEIPLIGKELSLFGELFYGEALGGYRAGIHQSFNTTTEKEVVTRGGYFNLVYKPAPKWMFVAGYGLDDPEADELGATGKVHNSTAFANVRYTFYKRATVGFEFDRMETDYNNNPNRINYRFQLSFMWKF